MHAIISERLRLSLHQHRKGVLTVTLHTVRCACEATFRVTVQADAPRDPGRYASFVQDGIQIYYSPRLDRASEVLELDSLRGLFQSKPVLVGPEELLARLIMGRIEAQNLTLGKEHSNVQWQGWLGIEGGGNTNIGQLALATALQHGFVAVLIFALIALLVTFFLKDVPFVTTPTTTEPEIQADEETEKELVCS